MRIGIFSDVHANVEALSSVVEALDRDAPDVVACLGDVVGYGASPNECADIVRETAAFTILGNHDAAVAGRMDYSYYYDAARKALDLHASLLSEDNLGWLRGLPYSQALDGTGVNFCHGSPARLEEFDYIFAPEQARDCIPMYDSLSHLTLIGHSHLCKVFELSPTDVIEHAGPPRKLTLRPDRKYIISVGSVGQPRDYDNRASFVSYDTSTREFSFRRVEYDIESAAQKIFQARLERNFGHRLFIGV
ncbi:MAG: metallophosphoesterase family protein [Myxococcales bacterium]|nr:metallophosphoesterase family protein [Myxococcales bacterium]